MESGMIAEKMLKKNFSTLIPSPAILHTFSYIYKVRSVSGLPRIVDFCQFTNSWNSGQQNNLCQVCWFAVFPFIPGIPVSFGCFCQSQSENIDTHNIWCNLVVQPFSQSKIFFEEELQPTVFVETFKNERLY